MTAVERMKSLINTLPKSDQPLGNEFINTRQFESLQELVDSAIQRTRRNVNSVTPKEEYLEVDMWELKKLKAEVDVYIEQLRLPELEENYEEEY